MGGLLTDLDEHDEAERALSRALRYCRRTGDRHHRIVVEANRARLLLRMGRASDALHAAGEARGLVEATGDERWLADVHLVSGAAHARMGRNEIALQFLERAGEIASERGDAKLHADVLLERALALRALGQNRDTLANLNDAHRIFLRLRARLELADVDTRLAELEAFFLQIVRDWGESIESKDTYTRGHCSRVAEYACALALASGFPEEGLSWFRMGALLHDVGKVAVPLEILNKAGPLTEEEFQVMATHPAAGVELLGGIEFPWDVRPMIRHHHERWNGTGYPDGLAGEAIPLSARILTVADVYDALTTDRSYRARFSHTSAMKVMAAEVGSTFDPALFELFRTGVAPSIAGRGRSDDARYRRAV